MLPELGHFALIVALFIAAVLGTLPIVGAARGHVAWMRWRGRRRRRSSSSSPSPSSA
jgi:cytochrome c biogenesis factor